MLKLQAIGNVGHTPEIIEKNDYKMARFSIATNKKVKGESVTTWVNVTVFGDKRCDFIREYVKKGAKLFVEGDPEARHWQTKAGDTASGISLTVSQYDGKLELVSAWEDGGRPQAQPDRQAEYRPKAKTTTSSNWDDPLDDSIPF